MVQTNTTIEQSKELLELGIDPKTADMAFLGGESQGITTIGAMSEDELQKLRENDLFVPAWSLSALMQLLPLGTIFISNYRRCHAEFCGNRARWGYSEESVSESIFESVFELVKKLQSGGYLQKGGNQ